MRGFVEVLVYYACVRKIFFKGEKARVDREEYAFILLLENFESCFHIFHMLQSERSILDQKLRRPKLLRKYGGPILWGEAASSGRVITL